MKTSRLASGSIASAALIAVGVAGPALASSYYSSSSPLKAYQDGVSQAEMYGSYSISNLTYARNGYKYRDPRPGGDSVYAETFYNWYLGATFVSDVGTDTSPKISTSTWTSSSDVQELRGNADSVRMYTNVCEDHGTWSKDPCSRKPTEKFNY